MGLTQRRAWRDVSVHVGRARPRRVISRVHWRAAERDRIPRSPHSSLFCWLFSVLLEPPAQSPGHQPWCTGPGGPGLTDYGRVPQRKPGRTCQLPSRDLTKP
jgi:hypothetical protein